MSKSLLLASVLGLSLALSACSSAPAETPAVSGEDIAASAGEVERVWLGLPESEREALCLSYSVSPSNAASTFTSAFGDDITLVTSVSVDAVYESALLVISGDC